MITPGHFKQASKRATQEYEHATRDEVDVAVAQTTEMSRAEKRERMGALENQADQTWTSHQVTSLNEMNSVATDALESHRRSLLSEATADLQRLLKLFESCWRLVVACEVFPPVFAALMYRGY